VTDFTKDWRPSRSPEASEKFAERVEELRSALQLLDPAQVATRSGASYLRLGPDHGELQVPFWGHICSLAWPRLTRSDSFDQPLTDFQLAFLFHHLLTADGMPLSRKWVSFADLPDGRIYNAAFQGYSGDEVAKTFGLNLDAFRDACISAGGIPAELASASFTFQPLPYVPLMITYWLGDEDFPSSCKILFDETAVHYLPIDGCAILGSMLVRRLRNTA
jgi:hypothetical protein